MVRQQQPSVIRREWFWGALLLVSSITTIALQKHVTYVSYSRQLNVSNNNNNNHNNDNNGAQQLLSSKTNSMPFSSTLPMTTESVNNELQTDTTINTNTNTKSTLTIKEYLEVSPDGKGQMVLFKWDSLGKLENRTGLNLERHSDWLTQFIDVDFYTTNQSQYGKVAIIYVWDTIEYVPWDITPPIPVVVYSMYRKYYQTTNYILGPNPYDQCGFSEWSVNKLLTKYETTMLNTTYDTFHSRNNTLIWRGKDHGEPVRKLLLDIGKELDDKLLNEDDLSAQVQRWLDVKSSDGHDEHALTEEELAVNYKYHLDVGGVSGTSWEGLRWKMCTGNLVFHVDVGAIDWWHLSLQDGIHFIVIKSDLSNLQEQYKWAESHPQEAYEIAQRGQTICLQSYSRITAQQVAIDMIHNLQDSTIEQIQQADDIFHDYYSNYKEQRAEEETRKL